MTILKHTILGLGCVAACVGLLGAPSLAQNKQVQSHAGKSDEAHAGATATGERHGDPYLLGVCPVSGEKLGENGEPVVRFCCEKCIASFEKDPAKYWKKVDEMTVKEQRPYYPLQTCPVSGEKLGEMGEPVDVVYNNRLVRLCCEKCKAKLMANPKQYMDKLDKAVIAMQAEHYPIPTCFISGEKLGGMGKPVDRVYGNRLVRFCCPMCIKSFEKNPTEHIAALDKAWHDSHALGMGHDEHGEHGEHGEHHGGG
jgi:YHS domain-containing protein